MTTALAAPPAAVADLVLARMALPSKRPVGAARVRADVGKLVGVELTAAEFDTVRDDLVSEGFLLRGKRNTFTLSDAGNERARQFLGVADIPPRTNWSTVIAKYLIPRAVGLSATSAAKLNDGDKLAAFVLKRKYGLKTMSGSTVNGVLEAIVCKRLGFSNETTLDGLLCAVLSQLLGAERLTKQQLSKQVPLFETGVSTASAEAIRAKLVRDWMVGMGQLQPPRESQPAEQFDLPAFAATVRALAANSRPQDRFHDNKVFIAALWEASQREPSFPRLSLPEFKQRLVEANSRDLLHLSRADLVQAMDPRLVADSETTYLNATFHFVLIEGSHR